MSKTESKAGPQQASDPQIAKLIAEQRRSGMSVAAFAKTRGIPAWKLYQAGRKRRSRRTEFVEVAVDPKEPMSSPLELLLPGDVRVLVPSDFDERTLQRLLGALASC